MSERLLKPGPLPDAAERRRIETELGRNFLVEAGAGSGKTTSLVARMIALLAADAAQPDTLVAVTFTRKAASQLRQKFQEKLEERLLAETDEAVKERLDRAQKALDLVRVGTIHSFCASLLRERPVEAGIDLGLSDVTLQEAALFQPQAWRERTAPRCRIGAMQFDADASADRRGRPTREQCSEQGRRLQRHADAFADQRMTISGGVTDTKHAVADADANSGTQRTDRQPRPLAVGALQRLADAGA